MVNRNLSRRPRWTETIGEQRWKQQGEPVLIVNGGYKRDTKPSLSFDADTKGHEARTQSRFGGYYKRYEVDLKFNSGSLSF